MSKRAVANRQYTDEFKVEAVRLSDSIGGSQAAVSLAAQRGQRLLAGNSALRETLDEI